MNRYHMIGIALVLISSTGACEGSPGCSGSSKSKTTAPSEDTTPMYITEAPAGSATPSSEMPIIGGQSLGEYTQSGNDVCSMLQQTNSMVAAHPQPVSTAAGNAYVVADYNNYLDGQITLWTQAKDGFGAIEPVDETRTNHEKLVGSVTDLAQLFQDMKADLAAKYPATDQIGESLFYDWVTPFSNTYDELVATMNSAVASLGFKGCPNGM